MSNDEATVPRYAGLNAQTWKPLSDWLDYTIRIGNCPSPKIAKKGYFAVMIFQYDKKMSCQAYRQAGKCVMQLTPSKCNALLHPYCRDSILFLMDSAILYMLNNHHVSAFYDKE